MNITDTPPTRRHRVVVIGSGFGGLFATKALRRANVDVTVIDRTTHHLFQPLLYQVATGILSEGEIAPSTRIILRKHTNTTVRLGEVTRIDLLGRTVTSTDQGKTTLTGYDSLIVSAGAQQSYFGNDHFAEHAPGMKTIDDALELRGRILGAFESAESTTDPAERERLLTFVVIGAGPTGVEMAGQIAELAHLTLVGAYRNIDTRDSRIILLDAAPSALGPFGPNLGHRATRTLATIGVDVQLGAAVTGVDRHGLTVRHADGTERRINAVCKVWSAGVAASPLARQLAAQTGSTLDRAGRINVNEDYSLPGHRGVFVIGDMATRGGLPGVAQVAIQGGRYVARQIKADVTATEKSSPQPKRPPFIYKDKGSMATISRFHAVAKIGGLQLTGLIAWILWLAVHVAYIVGFRSRLTTLLSWTWTFLGSSRGQLTITQQQVAARNALGRLHRIRHDERVNYEVVTRAG
ncbi:NAD(P)/FAD-dependent oxidoreductase (plasmid) [Rhodococcus pseudokoreensis]|uniref:NADH:ubiquinone reductase (non-electrogenic) n=1 Tax=Rhodococcus pseudokoreensis TaxID=2811421 RepID=A0A974VYA6_9NOCA|nr:NAD(P)/FAD-dependent oxidoreductase [Rhodococcus pseudokoreensis]QSE87848.1 NAD(P)/FAD-dependent oxidoreductase [Rhodococcus pseudokoreensis]